MPYLETQITPIGVKIRFSMNVIQFKTFFLNQTFNFLCCEAPTIHFLAERKTLNAKQKHKIEKSAFFVRTQSRPNV